MIMNETFLEVNDYLDLYLLAGSLQDKAWQQQIIGKMQDLPKEKVQREKSLNIDELAKEFRMINTDILDLYHQLHRDPENAGLRDMVSRLEQRRKYLMKKIHAVETKLQHHSSK
ncbi:hypothetical protein [Bacillus benzoevorans]|uniref:Uncharacterized protein n=1 Tax=Bacillus benzoevorans TaxID=1456 RepID=A0A7X0HMN4_9BACI|nr:hypothetical protein [Bacillus benzoevorans]MBB6443599.1 hypothetical protein [Bacillus benzoevorans]